MANKTPSNRDDSLAIALAKGETITDAARQAGLSARTAHRRLADPTFSERVRRLRGELVDRVCGRLVDSGQQAATTLQTLLNAQAESVRLSAAKSVLDLTLRFRSEADVESRISQLEQRINELLETRSQETEQSGTASG